MITIINPSTFSKLPLRRVLLPSLTHSSNSAAANFSSSTSDSNSQQRHQRYQKTLPHLPVPPLQQTLDKYLKTVKPLVNQSSFDQTKKLVEEFGKPGGKGEQLQKILEERTKSKDNWLSDWWLEHAYLRSRSPLVIHYSPSVSFPRYNFTGVEDQIRHAAKVISAILSYKVNIDQKSVQPEHMGKDKLCMQQYYSLLSTCRAPGEPMDKIHYHGGEKPPGHVTVAHNNQFFELKCYRNDGKVLTTGELESQLARIVQASPEREAPVGILTTADRDSWCAAYSRLLSTSSSSLKSIESSIFLLCLDDMPAVIEDKNAWRSDWALRCLHGGGSTQHSGNRWCDKTIQMIVDQNGGVGLVYEHSPAEGPPVAAMLDYVYEYCEKIRDINDCYVYDLPPPQKLKFKVDDTIKSAITDASKQLDQLVGTLNLTVREFTTFGKNFIKAYKISPDSFIQMAMQLTYFRLHHSAPATYESASLRRFMLGRTDTIRSCSIKSDEFVRAMVAGELSNVELTRLMRDAILEHKSYVTAAVSGDGIDRHLLGMRLAALERGEKVPAIFNDNTYQRAMQFNLSTSQVSCKADLCMAFGPSMNEGYGICYNPKPEKLFFSVSSFNNPDYDVHRFADEMIKSMEVMQSLLLTSSKL